VASPGGEGRVASDGGRLRDAVSAWREDFLGRLDTCPDEVLSYATAALSALNSAKVRMSPRRSRLLARSLLASLVIAGRVIEDHFRQALECSLPHACWGTTVGAEIIAASHRIAWDSASHGERRWLHAFMAERSLAGKLEILLDRCPGKDAGTQAVAQLIAAEPKPSAAAFAFAIYPAAASERLPIGAEGANDLGRLAIPLYTVNGEISWQERRSASGTSHPDFVRYATALAKLRGGRAERAKQFFNACLVNGWAVENPAALESDIEDCVQLLKLRGLAS
jgi:MoxR-like ATPase